MVIPAFYLQLNFAKYKRSGRFGYKMIPPGKVQVPGFCNSDLYQDVIAKGAKGLGISVSNENLSLIVSNGLIRDAPLPSGNPWTLGGYIKEFGGVQARGKRTFGIFMAFEDQEVESLEEFENQVRFSTHSRVIGHAMYVIIAEIRSRRELETSRKKI